MVYKTETTLEDATANSSFRERALKARLFLGKKRSKFASRNKLLGNQDFENSYKGSEEISSGVLEEKVAYAPFEVKGNGSYHKHPVAKVNGKSKPYTVAKVNGKSSKKYRSSSLTDAVIDGVTKNKGSSSYIKEGTSLGMYLKEISKTSSLNPEEEAEMAREIRKGSRSALNKLIIGNTKFVVSVCKNYQNQGIPLSDLINEGNLGLIRAAKRFDETKHFKFISYAVWWVRQALLQSLAENSRIIKIPPNRVGSIQKMGKVASGLEQKLGRTPTFREVAKEMHMKPDKFLEIVNLNNPYLSLDAPIQKGEDSKLMDTIEDATLGSPEDDFFIEQRRKEILEILDTLEGKEKSVVQLYFGIGIDVAFTLEEIGSKFKLTRERVRQIKEKAIQRLKHSSRAKKLEYLAA